MDARKRTMVRSLQRRVRQHHRKEEEEEELKRNMNCTRNKEKNSAKLHIDVTCDPIHYSSTLLLRGMSKVLFDLLCGHGGEWQSREVGTDAIREFLQNFYGGNNEYRSRRRNKNEETCVVVPALSVVHKRDTDSTAPKATSTTNAMNKGHYCMRRIQNTRVKEGEKRDTEHKDTIRKRTVIATSALIQWRLKIDHTFHLRNRKKRL